jgi:hypothetical protein
MILIVATLSDPLQQNSVANALNDNFIKLIFLLETLPGASCEKIGYRIGSLIRLIFNVGYDLPSTDAVVSKLAQQRELIE